MIQIVKQTHDEKMSMYMKSSKKELAEMVIECNRLLEKYIIPGYPSDEWEAATNKTIDFINYPL